MTMDRYGESATPAGKRRGQDRARNHFNRDMRKLYHNGLILSLLLNGESLTSRMAYRRLGALKLTPHIMDLREQGWDIQQVFTSKGEAYRLVGYRGEGWL